MEKKIIDISKYNTIKDWAKVAKEVEGVIIRCGYRGYGSGKITKDTKFSVYAAECKKYGIPFGVYFMSQAITEAEGVEEANYAVSCAKEAGATLPIFIDSEDGDGTTRVVRADGLSKDVRTAIMKAFCNQVIASDLQGGIYASESWFKDNLNYRELTNYLIWCAKYGKNTGAPQRKSNLTKVDMWQYTSKGLIEGIQGNVDVNICYFDFETGSTITVPQSNYIVGATCTLQENMYVRDTPSGNKKQYIQLTTNAKSHAVKQADGSAVLKKGTVVTVKEVTAVDGTVWIRIPSGWVCAVTTSGTIYVR